MNKRNTIFDFLINVFVIYGVTCTILMLFCRLFGEQARAYSSIFALGSEGLSLSTLLQFLLMSVLITTLRLIFFSDKLIKQLPMAARTIAMFASVIVMVGVFTAVFGWFPVDMAEAWLAFFVSFLICATVSAGISFAKEKSENRKMQEALERLREEK